ncbi:ABC transporter permease [Nostoc sp. 3335mG]|nr:ABC transporter permease [Nostoc sp. 3335mG]
MNAQRDIIIPVTAPPVAPRRLGIESASRWGLLLGPGLLILYWSVLSVTGFLDPRILPAPWTAVSTGVDLMREGRLQEHLAVSTGRALAGLFFGTAAGVTLALISGLTVLGGYVIDGLVQLKRGIPILALIPFMVLWFGIGEAMKVTVIATAVFFPIYIQTHTALSAIDIRYVELAETLRLSRWKFLSRIVLPGALPGFLTGLRFGATGAWLALVVVEQLNATSGIGYMITLARNYAQTDIMLVGLVVYAMLGFGSDALVRLIERRALRWRRTLGR